MATRPTRGRPSREAIHRQLAEGIEELRSRFGGLPTPSEAEDIWGDIWYQEAHNSTASSVPSPTRSASARNSSIFSFVKPGLVKIVPRRSSLLTR